MIMKERVSISERDRYPNKWPLVLTRVTWLAKEHYGLSGAVFLLLTVHYVRPSSDLCRRGYCRSRQSSAESSTSGQRSNFMLAKM